MKIHREGPVPPAMGRRLTKGNRHLVAGGRPETVGEESGHVQGDDSDRNVASPATGNDDEQQLLAPLREQVSREGPVKAAEALGVSYRTAMRAIETNTLTRRMEAALTRRQLESGGAPIGGAMKPRSLLRGVSGGEISENVLRSDDAALEGAFHSRNVRVLPCEKDSL